VSPSSSSLASGAEGTESEPRWRQLYLCRQQYGWMGS